MTRTVMDGPLAYESEAEADKFQKMDGALLAIANGEEHALDKDCGTLVEWRVRREVYESE